MSLTVYKSSAGSGKTFTLVREYIGIIIENPSNFRHILAITFTNKAANEMKSRILDYLNGLAYGPESSIRVMIEVLKSYLVQKTGLNEEQIRQRAETALKNILHGYSNFAVSTIDSFVHRLVRHFARELELPVNFDVELDTDKLVAKSIELLLGKVGSDPDLTKTLVSFVQQKMDDEKSWDVERELKEFTQILLRESSVDALRSLRKLDASDYVKIHHQLSGMIVKMEEKLNSAGNEAIRLINKHHIRPEDFFQGKSSIYAYFQRFAKGDFSKPEPNNYVNKMLDEDKWISGKCSAASATAIESIKPELISMLENAVSLAGELLPQIALFKLIQQNLYPTAVLSEIEQVMQEFRENENIVHISEFNKRISAIVGPEPVPFIYERIGEKYHHFLVDEFQDTSVLQWQNLLPLFENSLAANRFNMIVGDGKQAIYRWRNGEVEQFAALPEIYNRPQDAVAQMREQLLKQHFDERFLRQNFRSRKEIVAFNNRFFEHASGRLAGNLSGIYHELAQEADEHKTGGRVKLEFIPVEGLTKEEKLQNELQRILDHVNEFHDDEGYRLNDITVLTRKNDDASKVARFLIESGISVVTSEALQLSASPEVRFLIDNLRFLNDPSDPAVATDMLVFLLQQHKLPAERLHDLILQTQEIHPGRNGAVPLNEVIRETFGMHTRWNEIVRLNLYELVDSLVENFRLNPDGANPFIRFFKDAILDFANGREEDLSDFLEDWDEKGYKKSIVIPEETEAVRVMTIHKAKGLQFPVVIHPFASSKARLGLNEIWIEPEIEEIPQLETALVKTTTALDKTRFAPLREQEIGKSFLDQLNVLYVATTRPKERLVVLMHDKTGSNGEWKEDSTFPDVADLFYNFLVESGVWGKNPAIYTFGHEGHRDKPQEEFVPVEQTGEVRPKSGNWKTSAGIRFRAAENWNPESPDGSRDYGIMIHNIMAAVRTGTDIEQAVNEAIIEGTLSSDQKPAVIGEIRQIIQSPEISGFFDPQKKIITEKEIILHDGTLLRPDRIVIDDAESSVIDYKTGLPHESHRTQVDAYAEALGETGLKNIKKYLVYLNMKEKDLKVVSW